MSPAPPEARRVTDGVTPGCGACGRPLPPGRVRQWCSPACRQAAYRRRHPRPVPLSVVPPVRSRREGTVYVCPTCEQRYLGQQRCPDGQRFCQRLRPGGACPHCDEPVALSDLVDIHS